MAVIPGEVVALATFPGVIVHEIAHQFFCRLSRVAVLEVCYFRYGNPAGYVTHELPKKPSQHLLIGIGPFLVNTLLGALIALPAAIPALKFESGSFLDYFLIWLGVSIAMHSFPSTGDAKSIWEAAKNWSVPPLLRLVANLLVGIIYLGALGSFFWLDVLYGVGVALFLPTLLIWLLAFF